MTTALRPHVDLDPGSELPAGPETLVDCIRRHFGLKHRYLHEIEFADTRSMGERSDPEPSEPPVVLAVALASARLFDPRLQQIIAAAANGWVVGPLSPALHEHGQ